MTSPDAAVDAPDGEGPAQSTGRLRSRLSSGRRLARIAYRDPEHVAERLTLFGSERLSNSSLEWAKGVRQERPDAPRGLIAEEVRIQTAQVARIDGAVSGTPFLIALVPGYLAYLWQEGVMERRIAALYGHDPHSLQTSSQVLVLRGVHPTADAAREALVKVQDAPLPEKPTARRPLRVWVRSVNILLIYGGFLSAPGDDRDKYAHWRLRAALGFLFGLAIWIITWVLPVSFMIAMAWGCESHARSLGHRTMSFYGGESAIAEAGSAAAARTAAAPSATYCERGSSRSRSPSRSLSSPTLTTSGTARGSTGSAPSAPWSPWPSSSPRPSSLAGAEACTRWR